MRCMALARLATAVFGLASPAAAEVRLSTSVERVERWITESGELEAKFSSAALVRAGDELRYFITFTNTGLAPVGPGVIVITNPIPESLEYVWDSAGGANVRVLHYASAAASESPDGSPDGRTFAPLDELVVTEGDMVRVAAAAEVRAIRWIYQAFLPPGESGAVWFHVRLR